MRITLTLALRRRASYLVPLFALAAFAGCGGPKRVPVYQASGTVTIDGKSVGPARIVLQPESLESKIPAASGAIGSDGSFKLRTFTDDDGVAEGKFLVLVVSDPIKMTPVPTAKPQPIEIKRDGSGKIAPLKLELASVKGAKPTLGAPLPIAGGAPPPLPSMPSPRR